MVVEEDAVETGEMKGVEEDVVERGMGTTSRNPSSYCYRHKVWEELHPLSALGVVRVDRGG